MPVHIADTTSIEIEDKIITTQEPRKSYCNLSHEEMREGGKKIVFTVDFKNNVVQYCSEVGMSGKTLGSPELLLGLMDYIGFDTEDTTVFSNALEKVIGYLQRNITGEKLPGLLREIGSNPGVKMSGWTAQWLQWATTWKAAGYKPYPDGMAIPSDAVNMFAPAVSHNWRSKRISIDQTLALKAQKRIGLAGVVITPQTAVTTSSKNKNAVPTQLPVAPDVHVQVQESAFQRRLIEAMLQYTNKFSTTEECASYLDSEDGIANAIDQLLHDCDQAELQAQFRRAKEEIAQLKSANLELKKEVDELRAANERVGFRGNVRLIGNNGSNKVGNTQGGHVHFAHNNSNNTPSTTALKTGKQRASTVPQSFNPIPVTSGRRQSAIPEPGPSPHANNDNAFLRNSSAQIPLDPEYSQLINNRTSHLGASPRYSQPPSASRSVGRLVTPLTRNEVTGDAGVAEHSSSASRFYGQSDDEKPCDADVFAHLDAQLLAHGLRV